MSAQFSVGMRGAIGPGCLALLLLIANGVGIGGALAQTVEYIHTDALGTPTAVTDASRVVIERSEYEPYGKLLNRPLSDGPGYTGHVQDMATGMTYMQQRYYDPIIGRFLSVDPITANSVTGANFNRYWYAGNNPYKFMDPDGRQSVDGRIDDHETLGYCDLNPDCWGGAPRSGGNDESTVPEAPLPHDELNRSALNSDAYNLGKKTGEFIDGAWEELTERVLPAIPIEGQLYSGGIGLLTKFDFVAKYNPARAGHIFRSSAGHVAPATASSRARFVSLFEQVASNPSNLRRDAVKIGLVTEHAASNGVQGFTRTMSNGKQIWVLVRNGEIMNAGVNAAGAAK